MAAAYPLSRKLARWVSFKRGGSRIDAAGRAIVRTMAIIERTVPGFLPSVAGFHFPNRWPSAPALKLDLRVPGPVPIGLTLRVGDTASGLCGGMALAALDLWLAGEPPPPDTDPPVPGSPLFRHIVRCQLGSLEMGLAVVRFFQVQASSRRSRARLAVRDAWPAVRRSIDVGRPALLGLVHVASADPRRLAANHQVVAYGYELDAAAGRLALRIYDPNQPDDDAIRLRLTLSPERTALTFEYGPEAPVLGMLAL